MPVFKSLKDALKFSLSFQSKLIQRFDEQLDRDAIIKQQAMIIEDMRSQDQQQLIEECKEQSKDYLHSVVTRISTLLIQTDKGVYKREDSFQNESDPEFNSPVLCNMPC